MSAPRSIPVVYDLAIAARNYNILQGISQRVVSEPSRIDIAATRESVDVTFGVNIGDQVVIPNGSPANIVATVGTLPRFDQDGVGSFLANGGDEISIFGSNVNAAAQELRVQVRITALEDLGLIGNMG